MDFDFIRYKARVLQTTAYNVILFGAEIDIASEIAIQAVTVNSKPFIVIWASSLDIDAIVIALESARIVVETSAQGVVNITSVILAALHINTSLDEVSTLSVAGMMCGAMPIKVDSVEAVANIVTAMVTPAAVNSIVGFVATADVTATLWAGNYCALEVSIASKIMSKIILSNGSPIELKTVTYNYLEIESAVSADSPCDIESATHNLLDLAVVVGLNDNPIIIIASASYELLAVVDMSADDSKAIKSDAESHGDVDAILILLQQSTLASYDCRTLSSLDNMSLKALAYTE